jgi:hypothetical protein
LKQIAEDIQSDKVPIESNYWLKIIERMYSREDVEVLEVRIRENAFARVKLEIQK